jgi:hypothetical protein
MHISTLFVLAALSSAVRAKSSDPRPMVVHESVSAVPSGFIHAGAVPLSQKISLRIALAHTDIAALEEKTYTISDPANVLYGQHLTPEEVRCRSSPALVARVLIIQHPIAGRVCQAHGSNPVRRIWMAFGPWHHRKERLARWRPPPDILVRQRSKRPTLRTVQRIHTRPERANHHPHSQLLSACVAPGACPVCPSHHHIRPAPERHPRAHRHGD